jgi:glucose-1-phosphate adenylyltransferase
MSKTTLAVILGGGAGTRLFPLTASRSKPAVPIGGKYRLVIFLFPIALIPE